MSFKNLLKCDNSPKPKAIAGDKNMLIPKYCMLLVRPSDIRLFKSSFS